MTTMVFVFSSSSSRSLSAADLLRRPMLRRDAPLLLSGRSAAEEPDTTLGKFSSSSMRSITFAVFSSSMFCVAGEVRCTLSLWISALSPMSLGWNSPPFFNGSSPVSRLLFFEIELSALSATPPLSLLPLAMSLLMFSSRPLPFSGSDSVASLVDPDSECTLCWGSSLISPSSLSGSRLLLFLIRRFFETEVGVTEDEDGGFCGGGGVPCFTPGINGGGDVCMGQGEGLFREGALDDSGEGGAMGLLG
mmetsp:Transcript_33869/g.56937  ORF Transcript_33869/g.56937 Transcript_33869/m.56937 type:complete len:248 (+) Transcript_33869:1229-1972(+)